MTTTTLDETLAGVALRAVTREYPNKIAHLMTRDEDGRECRPRALHPAFYGSFDWHSAVHGHWALVRLLRRGRIEDAALEGAVRGVLAAHLTAANLATEVAYVRAPGRGSFERPYGLAWLLQLDAELAGWCAEADDAFAARLRAPLAELVAHAAGALRGWLTGLRWPVRSGTHDQTALSLGLWRDWAVTTGAAQDRALIDARALALYGADRGAPIGWEPSGHDFLSPALSEADLMRRVLPQEALAAWVEGFLGPVERPEVSAWLEPVVCPDASDGHLSHLDGLNLSRAWMLDGLSQALGDTAGWGARLAAAVAAHRAAGLAAARDETWWAGSHWLASFAVYLTTRRGLTAG